ncbi:hypothetical protein D3C80_1745310 [compost metagenome]
MVEVKPSEMINKELRIRLGEATNYAKGLLILTESPFKPHFPNSIGRSSLFGNQGSTTDKDFEFCTSVIMDIGAGKDIHNLCNAGDLVLDTWSDATDFCTSIWHQAGNIVQFLKLNS